MNKIIKGLVILSNQMDKAGLNKYADRIDNIIKDSIKKEMKSKGPWGSEFLDREEDNIGPISGRELDIEESNEGPRGLSRDFSLYYCLDCMQNKNDCKCYVWGIKCNKCRNLKEKCTCNKD